MTKQDDEYEKAGCDRPIDEFNKYFKIEYKHCGLPSYSNIDAWKIVHKNETSFKNMNAQEQLEKVIREAVDNQISRTNTVEGIAKAILDKFELRERSNNE